MNEHRPGNRQQNPAYSPPSLSPSRVGAYARVVPRPPALRPGDRVAVVSPSGPVEEAKLDRGLAVLSELELSVREGEHARERDGYLAGCDEDRLADLQAAVNDESLAGIFFSRGGYGLSRLLPRLDLTPLARAPRVVMGFSDITALQLAVATELDLATVYGPMVGSNFARQPVDPTTLDGFRRVVMGEAAEGGVTLGTGDGLRFLGAKESVTAPLVGGCLSLLAASLGTPWEVRTRGGVLFWEDVGEELYRLDRMLTHLKLAGKFDDLAGMMVGVGVGITRERGKAPVEDLADFLRWWFGDAPFPIVTSFPCSHTEPLVPLVLGRPVSLDPGAEAVRLPTLETRVEA